MTLYQLQSAQIDLAHKLHRNGEINLDGLLCKLRQAEGNLKEAVQYLLYEPIKSPEGKIAQMAMSELKMLRLSVENIKKDLALEDSELEMSQVSKSKRKSNKACNSGRSISNNVKGN